MSKYYDPASGVTDCEPTVMTGIYNGHQFSAEGIVSYPDEWPDDGYPGADAFNSAWEQISKQLPAGKPGDIVNLTSDDISHAGSLSWEPALSGGYWRYSPE